MMLPTLISVSLAPGSYVFCACAAVTVIVMAAATAMANAPRVKLGILSSPL